MSFEFKNGKIFVSQRTLNRLYHKTHSVWEVLRNEGAQILMKAPAGDTRPLLKGEQPWAEIVGVEFPGEEGARYMTTWQKKFTLSIPTTGEAQRVKECRVQGLPPLVAQDRRW